MKKNWLHSLAIGMVALPAIGVHAQSTVLAEGMNVLFRTADANNTSIKAYRTAMEKAERDVEAAKAQQLPDVKTSLSLSYIGNAQLWNRHFGDFINGSMPHFGNNFSLTAQQVVYSGGAITSGIRLAELGRDMETLNDESNRRSVRLLIAQLYLQRHSLESRVVVIDRNIALADTLLQRTRDRYEEGVVLKNDITRYELMREQMSLQKTVVENQISIVKRQLQTALAPNQQQVSYTMLPSEAFDITATQPEAYWQELAMAANSDLKKAQTAIGISEKQEKIARAALLPK